MQTKIILNKYEKYIYVFSCIILFLFSSLFLIRSVKTHYKFLKYPYQLEYREGAALNITNLYLNDRNPFAMNEQPQNTYVFGFLYPLSVTPVAHIFGNTLFVHRSFVYFFIIAACLIVFLVLLKIKVNFAFAFSAFVILHQSLTNAANTSIARPEGLGIFLLTLGIIIPWRWNYSKASLAVSIAIGILGYLTKPYYFIVILIIAAYLFIFVSKRKSIIYIAAAFLFLAAALTVTSIVYPLYLNNTVVYHITDSIYLYNYMKDQVAEYAEINVFLILIAIGSCLVIYRKYLKQHLKQTVEQLIEYSKSKFQINFNFKIKNDEPLIKSKYDLLFAFSFFFSLFVFIINLGGHTGNWHAAYLFHIGSPFLILLTFQLLEKALSKIYFSFAAVILIITMNVEFKSPEYDFDKFASCFKEMEENIKKSKNTLNSPENVSIMIQENKPVYNSGLSEGFEGANKKSAILALATKGVSERMQKFKQEMDEKISRKEFDLILLTKSYYSFFVRPDLLMQNYKLTGTICAPFPDLQPEVETWVPK